MYGPGGSRSRLAKSVGAEPCGQMKSCTPLWKLWPEGDVEKSATASWRDARGLKSKCRKHRSVGLLLEVEMMRKWAPLWHEADFPSQNSQVGS